MDPNNQPISLPQGGNQDDPQDQQSVGDDGSIVQDPSSLSDVPDITSYKEIPLPTEAEDTDLIEKEWVLRAKQIVEHTREDPHEQQRALSQMKADYMKKRYKKDIKLSED